MPTGMDDGVEPLAAPALINLSEDPEEAEAAVTGGGSPLTPVELDTSGLDLLHRAPGAALDWRVVVGVYAGTPEDIPPSVLDAALCTGAAPPGWVRVQDLDGALEAMARLCSASPGAACVLAQVLRLNEQLSLPAGLMTESLAYSMLLAGPEFARWKDDHPAPRPHPTDQPVVVGSEGGTITITLNRPEVRNAYDAAVRDALIDLLRSVDRLPETPRVVLTGSGPDFCSGGDLSQFGATADPVRAHGVRTVRSPGLLLDRVGATARVHGACIGAGIELPAFCSVIQAAVGSTFRLPELSMGLIPGAGGTASIPRRVGRQRTAYMALTGRTLETDRALEWGLVDQLWGT